MSEFLPALRVVLAHEGGFANDPDDPGGATNYGISLRYLNRAGIELDIDDDGDIDTDDIRMMSQADAEAIYREQWWDRYGYSEILDQALATKVFDLAVNMGGVQAHKCLQRAVRSVNTRIADDGILGPVTLSETNMAHPACLLAALRSEAAGFYRQIAIREKKKFLDGWLNRAYS